MIWHLPDLATSIIFRLRLVEIMMNEEWKRIFTERELQNFLLSIPSNQRSYCAKFLAVRTALRVFPLALSVLTNETSNLPAMERGSLVRNVFRALLAARVGLLLADKKSSIPATQVASAAASVVFLSADQKNNELTGYQHAALSASNAISCVYSEEAVTHCIDTVRAAIQAVQNTNLGPLTDELANEGMQSRIYDIWQSLDTDSEMFKKTSSKKLIFARLWQHGGLANKRKNWNMPEWASIPFEKFGKSSLVRQKKWGILYKWYRDILSDPGMSDSALNIEKELAIASSGNAFWQRDANFVMRELSIFALSDRPIDGIGGTEKYPDFAVKVPQQGPVAFRFSAADGPIEAVPALAETQQGDFARTTLSEAREKAYDLIARLEATNASQRVKRTVARVFDVLPEKFDALNPALLRSKTRSLEADAYAFAAAGAEAELFPEAVSELLDLTATIKDLQGCFSTIAEIERQAAEISVAGREAEAEEALARIGDSAQELATDHPDLVTQSAADAVNSLKADIADAPDAKIKARLIADASLTQSNFLAAAYSKVLSPTGREMIRVSGKMYHAAVDGTADGVRYVAAKGPLLALAYYLGGPLLAMAAIFASLKPLKDAQLAIEQQSKREPLEEPEFDSDGSSHPGQ